MEQFEKLGKENTPEYIRKVNFLTQSEMAEKIGCSFRTYCERIIDKHPWTFPEILKLWDMNKNRKLILTSDGQDYEISIKRV